MRRCHSESSYVGSCGFWFNFSVGTYVYDLRAYSSAES